MKSLSVTFLFLLAASLFISGSASSNHTHTEFLECLVQFTSSNSISDVIYSPSNASYSSIFLSAVRNQRHIPTSRLRPMLIITPDEESDIQAAVYCSRKLGVQIRVRSGGHDYEGLAQSSELPFVMIDMRNLKSISIDTEEDNTAWVQTGASLGQLYYAIAQRSRTLAFTAGVCTTVGVGGHFSGGGYGMISRKHGIAVDNIIDARLIDANGRVLDRRSMGEDLFWAIRGGGGTSFGIVIAFKVNLITVPEIVTVFNVSRTLEQNATQLVHKWQYISDNADENLLLRLFLRSIRSPVTGNRTIQASFTTLYLGRVNDLLPLMQETFPELGVVEQDCIEMSWIDSTLFFARLRDAPHEILLNRTQQNLRNFKGKSDYVTQPISERGLEGIWRFLNEEHENLAEIQFSPYGGILNTVSESETPFPHRAGTKFMIHYIVFWTRADSEESERHMSWIRNLYAYMEPYVSKSPRAAYFNYRDFDIGMNNQGSTSYKQASVWGFKYFKNNFRRLVRVKTMVDPSNFFRNEQSIPPLVSLKFDLLMSYQCPSLNFEYSSM